VHFSWWLLLAAFLYSMVGMGTHGTIWYHRYSTHNAYTFRNSFWRFLTSNLVIKALPEEIYVVSHHVHHAKSDQPGDPYNANGGFLYCFLADVNHQPIAKNLSVEDYDRVKALLKHTGIKCNSYSQYLKWGSAANPYLTILHIVLNWAFWYGVFFLIGGHAFACALFGGAFFWAVGVRTFNYEGHGKGKDRRTDGMDFNRQDMSVNQYWPGIVAGEWHNNHHLYPSSARAGFLKYQVDFAWYYVYLLYKIGGVSSFHNSKKQFDEKYYTPYRKQSSSN
jgi:sn-1 stearoyl-lipid 9-desaturase